MYRDLVAPISYVAPWTLQPLDQRIDALRRGRTRIAWLYERPDTSTFRYRCFNPQATLRAERPDIGCAWFELADEAALWEVIPTLDVLVIARVRYNRSLARVIMHARAANVRIMFDCDDLVFDTRYVHLLLDTLDQDTRPEAAWDTWFAMIGRIEATARLCDAGLTTNAFLADRLQQIVPGPVSVIPNYFEPEQEAVSRRLLDAKVKAGFSGDGHVTIGYFSGTPTHNRDLAVASPAIARLMQADPMVSLRIVGFLDDSGPLAAFPGRVELVPLQDYLNLQRVIAEVDINIAPLQDNPFTNCKSELKFFEAAAVGVWTIATPTFTFRNAINDGETGRLARAHEWDACLAEAVALVRNPARYKQLALAAADAAYLRYGWQHQAEAIVEAVLG